MTIGSSAGFSPKPRTAFWEKMYDMNNLTFAKSYVGANSVDADYARGVSTGTFTRTAGDTTYIDADGVVQVQASANAPRWTQGQYGATGFVTNPGLMMEDTSSNLIKMSNFSSDGTNWTIADDVTAVPTVTYTDATDLINISGAQSHDTAVTFTDGTYLIVYSDISAVGTTTQNDLVTVSMWMKGTSSGVLVKLRIKEYDAAGVGDSSGVGDDIAGSLSATEWRRFSFTYTMVDADASRATASYFISGMDNGDTMDISITGVQLEVKNYATSLIPTTTAAVTRAVEGLLYKTSGNRTAATESMIMQVAPHYADSVTAGNTYLANTQTKSRLIRFNTGADTVTVNSNATDSAASATTDLINDTWVANESMTLGYSLASTGNPNIACYWNGVADGSDDNDDFTAPTWGTDFWLGGYNATTATLDGIIKSVAFFSDTKTAANHATLQLITDNIKEA